MTAPTGNGAHRCGKKAHEWWGDHSVWSDYSEEGEEGSRERKPGPALRILLIRSPDLRSHRPGWHNPRNLRIRPYSKYLKFAPGNSRILLLRAGGRGTHRESCEGSGNCQGQLY